MGMRVRVTQTGPALGNGSPVILPGLRPVTATIITSNDDAAQHPCFVTLPYINNDTMSCFYINCETLIGNEKKLWVMRNLCVEIPCINSML